MATQAQFEAIVAEEFGWSKAETRQIFEAISGLVVKELRKRDGDKKVALRGLGTFKLVDTPAKPRRKGRNPATGEEIMLKAKPKGRKVKVLVNKGLRDTLKAS